MKTKPSKIFRTKLLVSGSGEFPIDMLRYDSCCPFTEADSHTMSQSEPGQPRIVVLKRFSVNGLGATEGRWKSFGWKVVSEEPIV